MNRWYLAFVLLLGLTGCGDPDDTRATTEDDPDGQGQPATAADRPDVINRSETPSEESDLAGVPLAPAIDEVERPRGVRVCEPPSRNHKQTDRPVK